MTRDEMGRLRSSLQCSPSHIRRNAGPAEKPSDKYYKAAQLADALSRDLHYTVDEKQKAVLITDDGYEAAEDVLEARDS
jgi:preprotein translocase subunit SecA